MLRLVRFGVLVSLFGAACTRDDVALAPTPDMTVAGDLASASDLGHVLCSNAFNMATQFSTGVASIWFSVLADFNGDGKLDIAVTNGGTGIGQPFPGVAGHTVGVLFGNGDGSFQTEVDYTTGDGPIGVAAADLNGDGKPDLVVGNGGPNGTPGSTVSVLLNKGDGTFAAQKTYATGRGPYGLVLADLDGDGVRDLAVTNEQDNTVSILVGKGDGTFKPQATLTVGSLPLSVVAVDLDKDGHLDLAVANNANGAAATLSILLGKGDGTFRSPTAVPLDAFPFSIASDDLDKDGNVDLVVANTGVNAVDVILGKGDGTFAPHTRYKAGSFPIAVAVADVDADGRDDILVSNTGDSDVGVYLNNGDGTFASMVTFDSISGSRLAVGDINSDGKPDVVTPVSAMLGHGCP